MTLRATLAGVLALELALLSAAAAHAQPARSCTVERIIDGDTFVCGDDERVRLLLVNAPEMSDEPLGRLAREFVRSVMPPGTEVRLELDVQERDRYGRLLAYVRLPDGRLLNRVVAREGYARVMVVPPNVDRVEEMREAVDAARREGVGLWGRPPTVPDRDDLEARRVRAAFFLRAKNPFTSDDYVDDPPSSCSVRSR